MPAMMTQKLSYLKKRDGLTAKKLSELSGVPIGTLNKILNGDTKKPSMETMGKIALVFQVPVRYFLDDGIPVNFKIGAFVWNEGFLLVSEQEKKLLEAYRKCTPRERDRISEMAEFLTRIHSRKREYGHLTVLPCYMFRVPQEGRPDAAAVSITKILVSEEEMTRSADFAVEVSGTGMEPLYREGEILAVRYGRVKNNQVGIFLYQGEGYIRRLSEKNGVRRLVALNRRTPTITVAPEALLETVGTVLGAVRPVKVLR